MTGYGKGVAVCDGKTLTVEIKAVNNRFLEINARLPKYLAAGDEIVRKEISSVLRRGTVDVFFDLKDDGGDKVLSVDNELASLYISAARQLSEKFGLSGGVSSIDILKLGDVVSIDANTDVELLCEMLREATAEAVKNLDAMRSREGEGVKRDLARLAGNVSAHLAAVTERAPKVVSDYREKLLGRIKDYLGEVEPDEARLLNEVAFFADKADINEEISRLGSHIEQFNATLESGSEAGRKLDFVVQEMNREVNTMGSKSNDVELTRHVVAMKNEIEKIKEQVRNVE